MTVGSISVRRVDGLLDEDVAVLVKLVEQLNRRRSKNELRRSYYDGHNALKDLGIAVPPQLKSLDVVVGWPAKAVDSLSRRTILNGFSSTGGSELEALVTELWDGNRIAGEASAAHTAALIHSCSFVFVTQGQAGEPDAVITTRSAEHATGTWDARKRALVDALSVVEYDMATAEPTLMHLYLFNRVAIVRRVSAGVFEAEYSFHSMGVPVEVLPYRPMGDRPFGRSRITRGVRYLTDAAARTLLRSEVGAEFYNAPQRYVLGADEESFVDASGSPVPAWSVMLGRMLALSRDENGELPTVGQFSQQTMQPNVEQLRSLAQMFAAETSLPVGSLGIVQDNPSSAEAIRAVNEEQGIEIEHWQRSALGPAWKRVMRRAVGMVTDSPAALAEVASIAPDWGSWALASDVALADAAVKQVTAVPWLADSAVLLKRMGFSPDDIRQLQAERRRSQDRSMLQMLIGGADGDVAAGESTPVGAGGDSAAG